MTRRRLVSVSLIALMPFAVIGWSEDAAAETPTAEQLEFFERSVRPLLAEHCYSCHSHGAEKLKAGLHVDSRAAMLIGGDSGPSLIPGDPDGSLLIEAVRYESYEMPPKGRLPDADVAVLERWVKMGAPWPAEDAPNHQDGPAEFDLQKRRAEHWAWQPVMPSLRPKVSDESWPLQDLDYFVLSELEQAELSPAVDADKRAILRRMFFDFIGLPPTPEQVARFLSDESSDAVSRLADRLLASPHFGERWARHWMDVVRYAESRGHEFDNDARNAYQYRDYLIRAFNSNVPYDQFVREHIAGDLLEEPRLHQTTGFNESILGTGFWHLGEWVHSPVDIRKDESDRFDNMIDVMSKAFLGVTVSCARCHDHKFDAISTADYYSLSGFLQSSDYRQVRFESLEHNREVAQRLHQTDQHYRTLIRDALAAAGISTKHPDSVEGPIDVAENIVVDFAKLDPIEFRQDGFVFGAGAQQVGDILLTTDEKSPTIDFAPRAAAVADNFWQGLESVSEKPVRMQNRLARIPRSGRTLRTPVFTVHDGSVACRVRGSGHVVACVDSHRLISGPLHGQTIQKIEPDKKWVSLNLERYVGHRVHLEFTPATETSLEISLVIQGASPDVRCAIEEYELQQEAAIVELQQRANAFVQSDLESAGHVNQLIRQWAVKRAALQQQVMKRSHLAMGMLDGTGEDDHVLIRGNSARPGDSAPRRFLTALAGPEAMAIPSGSGRQQLAEHINAADNPLTPRVIVNRVWHHLMGRGIVPTTDDFGVLGQRPSHPKLLDHLASWFMEHDRSIHQLIRYIVSSRTYQMSSQVNQAALAADPKNKLWHYRPPQRLQGEVIRDALLMLSGRLDRTMFGQPVPIHLTKFMDGRGRPKNTGPLDGNGRRSVYIAVRRNFLSPFMLTFDTPVPFSSMGRRNVSNVPAQALILMNDPFVANQARLWAERCCGQVAETRERIQYLYESAFARPANAQELKAAQDFVASRLGDSGLSADEQLCVWADLAHALINTKEFIFLR